MQDAPNTRNTARIRRGWLIVAALALAGGSTASCSRRRLPEGSSGGGTDGGVVGVGGRGVGGAGGAGNGGAAGAGGGIGNAGGTGGAGIAGTGGAAGLAAACSGASDSRLVVADQRILRLTANETLNTVRFLFGDAEATALVRAGFIGAGDDSVDRNRRFPPLQEQYIDSTSFPRLDNLASQLASYVLDNFATVTGCSTATDACATAYLDTLATKAYRRRLAPDERTRFTALYAKLRAVQTVNGYDVTFTVEEATSFAVDALLSSPQMLWRWELGDPAMASSAPAGVPLTDAELATHLAFFLTDQPPDDMLLGAATAGTLRASLASHVQRLLATQTARDWLRTILETVLTINQVPDVAVDPVKFPIFTPALASDMATEARKFLDDALWSGTLTDLLLSRRAFLNSTLARDIYGVAVPAGATVDSFVRTTLPADQRSGLLTNAAFLAVRARADGSNAVVPRGVLVDTVLLCMPPPADPGPIDPGQKPSPTQTAQEQVAVRAAVPLCNSCHSQFDPYGLALDAYDSLGRFRIVDDMGRPIDAHATLPAAIGGGAVASAVELAGKLAAQPAFTNCMAQALLQYAMVDLAARVEIPLPPQQAGCATADIVQRFNGGSGRTFADLVRTTAAAPAFVLRRTAP